MIDPSPYRGLFPSADAVLHLDHAGVAPISTRVADALGAFAQESVHALAHRYPYWEQRAEAVRAACGRLSGAPPRQVAFVKNTSEALSFVATGLDWGPGDTVVLVDEEFPSNVYPWWALEAKGVECRTVSPRAVMTDLGLLEEALAPGARLLAVSAAAYGTGDLRPLADLAELCRKRDTLLVVDAIQALGAVSMDLTADGLDCVAADGHKWICAPEGGGWMALSERLLDRLSPSQWGWKTVEESSAYYPYRFQVRDDAAKLEAGSLNFLAIHGLGAAVDLILEVGIHEIEARLRALTEALTNGLRERGLHVLGNPSRDGRRSGILTFESTERPERLRQELWARGVVCKERFGGLRLAPHHYQDERDVNGFFERLDDARRALA